MDTEQLNGAELMAEALPQIAQKLQRADDTLVDFVRQRPLTALATALAIGYLVGRVASRFG